MKKALPNASPKQIYIFCDASYDPQLNLGVTGFLCVEDNLTEVKLAEDFDVTFSTFQDTSIARLELAGFLAALDWVVTKFAGQHKVAITVYSDCKAVTALSSRRAKLEQNEFKSRRTCRPLANADLYRKFFEVCDQFRPEIIWIKGHSPSKAKHLPEKFFTLVDRATRKSLRAKRESASI